MDVVAFLEGRAHDGRGRTLADVLAFDDAALERHHDYIQWLFPLDEPSRAVPGSPVLSPAEAAALRANAAAHRGLDRALDRMRAFYGATTHWLVPGDHNHLRITRILKCLVLLGRPADAATFHAEICAITARHPGSVTATTRTFWSAAVADPQS